MTSTDGRIAERRIPGSLLAGIRFLGQFDELPERFTRLRAVAQEADAGQQRPGDAPLGDSSVGRSHAAPSW